MCVVGANTYWYSYGRTFLRFVYLFILFVQDDEDLKTTIAAGSKSLLPMPVQELIKMIFDVESMKKTLVEFEVSQNFNCSKNSYFFLLWDCCEHQDELRRMLWKQWEIYRTWTCSFIFLSDRFEENAIGKTNKTTDWKCVFCSGRGTESKWYILLCFCERVYHQ